MRINRFYCPNIQPGDNTLDASESHHLIHVLRHKTGDAVTLFDGKGTVTPGIVGTITRKSAIIRVEQVPAAVSPPAPPVIIAPAVAKGPRFDDIITKTTELAVDVIAPIRFERTVKQASSKAAAERMAKLAVSAAKQSHNPFLPVIHPPQTLTEALDNLAGQYPELTILFGHPDPAAKTIQMILPLSGPVAALVGPEGGLTDTEIQTLTTRGAIPIRLTETILRVETAAIVITAMLTVHRNTP